MQRIVADEWSGALSAATATRSRDDAGHNTGQMKSDVSCLRHTSGEHAAKPTMRAALIWRLGRVNYACLLGFGDEELSGSEPLDEMHESIATRILP
jgi:hypothetical protein